MTDMTKRPAYQQHPFSGRPSLVPQPLLREFMSTDNSRHPGSLSHSLASGGPGQLGAGQKCFWRGAHSGETGNELSGVELADDI